MIESTSFLGFPLRTPHQRRCLVVGYYAVLLLLAAISLWKTHVMTMLLLPQSLAVGCLLGGTTMGGPVKPYRAPAGPDPAAPVTLNLQGRRRFGSFSPLDEREQMQCDHAHYTAYRILILTLGFAVPVCYLLLNWKAAWLEQRTLVLVWFLLIYAMSLPQSVLLWTEPAEPSAELIEMR